MTEFIFAKSLVFILLAAFTGGFIARSLKLPTLVGYLVSGMIIGSFASKLEIASVTKNIAEIGVVLLLFTIGLEFSMAKLKEFGEVIIFGSLIQILLTIGISMLLFPLLGFNFYEALFLGATFSLSSTAVSLKILSDKGELETVHGEISSGWLFMHDLYTLPLLIILLTVGMLVKGEESGFSSLFLLAKSLLFAFVSFTVIIYLGKRIVPYFIEKIADCRSRELVLIAAVFFCFSVSYLFEFFGLSYALGAFVSGMILSSSSSHHGIFAEVRPLRDLFGTIFFVSLGFVISPVFLFTILPKIIILVIIIISVKFIVSFLLIILMGFHSKVATLVSLSLISIGEFAFILGILGVSLQIISPEIQMIILSSSFVTLTLSVPIISYSDKFYYQINYFIKKRIPILASWFSSFDKIPCASEFILHDHVVVLGHGRIGRYICDVLVSTQIPYVVVDYNHKLVKHLRERGVCVIYGDPAEIDVLEFAHMRTAKAVILAYADRHTQETVVTNILTLNSEIKIICRAHFDEDQQKLKSLGADTVVQPEFEAAISMAEKLLNLLYKDSSKIEEKLRKLRNYQGLE